MNELLVDEVLQNAAAQVSSHGQVCDFGAHKGKYYTRLPAGYLRWMISVRGMPLHRRALALAEIKRRGTPLTSLEVSRHAVDRASLYMLHKFLQRTDRDKGLLSWLSELAEQSRTKGIEISPGKYEYDEMIYVFDLNLVWPVLVTVMKKNHR